MFFKVLAVDAALAQMERGELELMIVPTSEMNRIQKVSSLTVVSVPSPSIDFLAVNLAKNYLQDKRVRQPMQYAIDRAALVHPTHHAHAQAPNQPILRPALPGTPHP